MLLAGGQGVVHFNVVRQGVDYSAPAVSASVWLNEAPTATPVVIAEPTPGHYVADFDLPASWQPGGLVAVKFVVDLGRDRTFTRVKEVGRIDFFDLDYADQGRSADGTRLLYTKPGTGGREVLLEQVIAGDPCLEEQVTIRRFEPNPR